MLNIKSIYLFFFNVIVNFFSTIIEHGILENIVEYIWAIFNTIKTNRAFYKACLDKSSQFSVILTPSVGDLYFENLSATL